jgi:hypothetical protein
MIKGTKVKATFFDRKLASSVGSIPISTILASHFFGANSNFPPTQCPVATTSKQIQWIVSMPVNLSTAANVGMYEIYSAIFDESSEMSLSGEKREQQLLAECSY